MPDEEAGRDAAAPTGLASASSPAPRLGVACLTALVVLLWGWTLITALLAYASLTQQQLLFCAPKSGCDEVLRGKYASLLGVPLAVWGLGSALLLCALLLVSLLSSRHARLAMRAFAVLSLLFTVASGVFVHLQLNVLQKKCVYCLASSVLVVAIFIVGGLVWDRVKAGWTPQLSRGATAILAVVPTLGALVFLGMGLAQRYAGGTEASVVLRIQGADYTEGQWRDECADQLESVNQKVIEIQEDWVQKKIFEYNLEVVAADRGKTQGEIEAEIRAKIKVPEEEINKEAPDRREALRRKLEEKLYRDELIKLLDPKKKPNVQTGWNRPVPRVVKLDTEGAEALGPRDAPVEVIVISDFECPFCLKTAHYVDELRKGFGDRVRLVVMHNVLPGHKSSKLAAAANECAAKFGKFWEYRKLLFEKSPQFDRESLLSYAQSLGIDPGAFAAELDSGWATRRVEHQTRVVSLSLNFVPIFLINGKVNTGAVSLDALNAAIRETLQASAKPAPPSPPK